MNYYSHNGNRIMIGHFPGITREEPDNAKLLDEYSTFKFTKPNDVGIICAISDSVKEIAPLIKQLKANGYDYYNAIDGLNLLWKKEDKIKYVLDSLKLCEEEYSLILDGSDVVIMSDLDDIVDKYKSYNKDIIYNSTIWMYPHVIIDIVENRGQYGQYCYLNAGCAIGKTKELIKFYEETWELVTSDVNRVSSEQYYIRKAFDTHQDTVFFDWQCKIFQCWHRQAYRYEKNGDEDCCILL